MRDEKRAHLWMGLVMLLGPAVASAAKPRSSNSPVRFVILGTKGSGNDFHITTPEHYRQQRNLILHRGSNLTWPSDIVARRQRSGTYPTVEQCAQVIVEVAREKFAQRGKKLTSDVEVLITDIAEKSGLLPLLEALDGTLGEMQALWDETSSEHENSIAFFLSNLQIQGLMKKLQKLHRKIAATDDLLVSSIESLRDEAPLAR